MLVFRENRVSVSAQLLLRTLAEKLRAIESGREGLLDALLSAGEVECALADAGWRSAARIAQVTDELADAVVYGCALHVPQFLETLSAAVDVPTDVKISPPEGFAYYTLHPLKYSDVAANIPLETARAAVIGIRSIGTTLSAMVAARLRRRGVPAERITVRPHGHPFQRVTNFTEEQAAWIAANRTVSFLVVDEGPGLSGSSFLSVGESLLGAGVARERIRFVCSHYPNPETLRAENGALRWSSFAACAVERDSYLPAERALDLSGGGWRRHVFSRESEWPSSWPQMERVKFLSADRKQMFKFEGYGKFGTAVCERNRAIARAGFGPELLTFSTGFAAYPWIQGQRGAAGTASEPLLARLADYCAFRAEEFRGCAAGQANLVEMARCNIQEEFGVDADIDGSHLEAAVPTIVDGRMHPHEWVRSEKGEWLKVDGGSHGDDHFYPGPADIAWDLAGTIVEWKLDRAATEYFLDRYRARSGDDPASRLPAYLLAYAAFRLGYCQMAAESVGDGREVERLTRDYRRYRSLVEEMLPVTSIKLQASTAQR